MTKGELIMASDLTGPQRAMLALISNRGGTGRQWWDGESLLAVLGRYHHTTQGVHQTASSLVRRGYLEKTRRGNARRVAVFYGVTALGRQVLAADRYVESRRS